MKITKSPSEPFTLDIEFVRVHLGHSFDGWSKVWLREVTRPCCDALHSILHTRPVATVIGLLIGLGIHYAFGQFNGLSDSAEFSLGPFWSEDFSGETLSADHGRVRVW